jgi:hypothetical protein
MLCMSLKGSEQRYQERVEAAREWLESTYPKLVRTAQFTSTPEYEILRMKCPTEL